MIKDYILKSLARFIALSPSSTCDPKMHRGKVIEKISRRNPSDFGTLLCICLYSVSFLLEW